MNVELLGCRYPTETMAQVALLASAVPEVQRYRASRRNRLKRTFIGAQDAVQAKLQKSSAPRQLQGEPMDLGDWSDKDKADLGSKYVGTVAGSIMRLNESQKSDNLRALLKDVIYFEMPGNDPNGSLNKTISIMRKVGRLEMKYDADEKKFFYIFNSQIVAEGVGDTKKAAKKSSDDDLVATLKANCFTIKSKCAFYSPEDVIQPKSQNADAPAATNKLQEDNIGFKMLKMLGWSGGSLGAKSNGIIDPVNLEIKIGRKGFGSECTDQFDEKHIRNLLKSYKNNQVEYDLVFSNEFTKEERARIHL